VDVFDAKKAASLTKRAIEEACKIGECVIVGRGSQCVLRNREDVFHAFIYAGWEEKALKIRERAARGSDVEALIRSMDAQRVEYVRVNYRENWLNPHLYDVMIDSKGQSEKVARLIISAMKMVPAV